MKKAVDDLHDQERNQIDLKKLVAIISMGNVDFKKMYEDIKRKDTA